MVHDKPINWYIQFYHRINGSFRFNSIEFRELLERLRINGCKLAEDEIEEIYNYTINMIVPPSFIEQYERRKKNESLDYLGNPRGR